MHTSTLTLVDSILQIVKLGRIIFFTMRRFFIRFQNLFNLRLFYIIIVSCTLW